MKKAIAIIALMVFALTSKAQQENILEYHVDEWGVYIDTFFIKGPVYPTDSLYILIGTEENLGDIRVYKDLTNFDYEHSGIEGWQAFTPSNDYWTGSRGGRVAIFLSARDMKELIRYVTIIIKREGTIIGQVSASSSLVTGTGFLQPSQDIFQRIVLLQTESGNVIKNISNEDLKLDFYSLSGHWYFRNYFLNKNEEIKLNDLGVIIIRDLTSDYMKSIKVF